jgi:predicted nuclease with TOPRIM domain
METLKKKILGLLDKDVEFRYAVAGYLGLSEILKKLDTLAEEQVRLREEQTKIWMEITKIWEEIKIIREEQTKLWEGQNRLWEGQNRLWEEVRNLREGQAKLWEGQNKLWEEVKLLRVNYERMRKYMLSGFRELSASIGVAFEDHAAAFLNVLLDEAGYPDAKVGRKVLAYNGEAVEINLFCEKPLLVGEATVSVKSAEEAEREIRKLLERVRIIEEKYGRKPEMIVLSVARATEEAIKVLKNLTEKHGVKLILGKEIEETLAI